MVNLIGNEKIQFDEFGNLFFLRTISKSGQTEKLQPENCTLPLMKELTVSVILKRTGYTHDMREKTYFGLIDLKLKIPTEKALKNHYFAYDKKAMSNVCVVVFDPNPHNGQYSRFAYDFNPQPSLDSQEHDWVKRIGKEKALSLQKVQTLIQNNEVLAILSDNGEVVS
jgi:outer membrane receptor for ferric coprogen and ferric-rhodotorulic acid